MMQSSPLSTLVEAPERMGAIGAGVMSGLLSGDELEKNQPVLERTTIEVKEQQVQITKDKEEAVIVKAEAESSSAAAALKAAECMEIKASAEAGLASQVAGGAHALIKHAPVTSIPESPTLALSISLIPGLTLALTPRYLASP